MQQWQRQPENRAAQIFDMAQVCLSDQTDLIKRGHLINWSDQEGTTLVHGTHLIWSTENSMAHLIIWSDQRCHWYINAVFPGKIISGFDRFNPESTNLPFLGIESRRRSNRAIKRAKTILTELATLRPVVELSLARSRVFMVLCAGAKSELTQTRSARRESR